MDNECTDNSNMNIDISSVDTKCMDNPKCIQQIACLFCRGTVKFKKFFQHIQNEHDVLFDYDLILKLCLIGREGLENIVNKTPSVETETKVEGNSIDINGKIKTLNKDVKLVTTTTKQDENDEEFSKEHIKIENEYEYEDINEPEIEIDSQNKFEINALKEDISDISTNDVKKKTLKTENTSSESSHAYTCELCFKTFNTLCWFYNHCKKFHSDHPEILPKNYAKLGPLDTLHSRIRDDNGEIMCGLSTEEAPTCRLTFTRYLSLIDHERTHKSAFLCILCGVACYSAENLIAHCDNQHEKVSTYMCRICGFFNRTGRNHKDHTEQEHMKGTVKYQCDECEYSCGKINAFKAHKRINHKDAGKVYMCDTCGKKFSNPSGLYQHALTHNPDSKTFDCDYCTKKFYLACKLNVHLKVHIGEKPECCDLCGKRFGSKTELKTHKNNVHVEEKDKPYSCDVCGRRFADLTVYRNHCKLHTGIKDEMCNICGKAFFTRRALRKHERSVHPTLKPLKEKPFKISTIL